jgi:hypothetical protein
MDLSLLIFMLFSSPFCMKCIEFTTRTYNFKNLAVGWVGMCSVKIRIGKQVFVI